LFEAGRGGRGGALTLVAALLDLSRCAGEVGGGTGAVLGFGPGLGRGLGFAFGVEFGDEGEECTGLGGEVGGEVGGVLVEGVEGGGHAFGVGDEFGEEGEDGLSRSGEGLGDGGGGHGWMMSDGCAASRGDFGGPQVCARGATMGGKTLSGGVARAGCGDGCCAGCGRCAEGSRGERQERALTGLGWKASAPVEPPGAPSRAETPAEPEAKPALVTARSSSSAIQATPSSANPPPNSPPKSNTPAPTEAEPAARSPGESISPSARTDSRGAAQRRPVEWLTPANLRLDPPPLREGGPKDDSRRVQAPRRAIAPRGLAIGL